MTNFWVNRNLIKHTHLLPVSVIAKLAALVGGTGQQHWSAALVGGTGQQHWLAALVSSTGWQNRLAALVGSTGQQHWAAALVGSIGQQHWLAALLGSAGGQRLAAAFEGSSTREQRHRLAAALVGSGTGGLMGSGTGWQGHWWAAALGPDYQNACKVTMFSTLYLELQHESYNVPAML